MKCDTDINFQEPLVHEFDFWSHINNFGEYFVKIGLKYLKYEILYEL